MKAHAEGVFTHKAPDPDADAKEAAAAKRASEKLEEATKGKGAVAARKLASQKAGAASPSVGGTAACGSCYGAAPAGSCCNTCDDVREAYRKKGWGLTITKAIVQCHSEGFLSNMKTQADEGCRIHGYLDVDKSAGHVHFAPGRSFQHAHLIVHDLFSFTVQEFNVSHVINDLSFGEKFPDMQNPLAGVVRAVGKEGESGMFQYYTKIVPTDYQRGADGPVLETNQYSVTEHFQRVNMRSGRQLPGVYIYYDLSPLRVRFVDGDNGGFSHFLTNVCAIVGGVFTVMGMVDLGLHNFVKKALQKRVLKW